MNFFILIRFLIGCIFLVSAFEKLTTPYQNFLLVIESYQLVPTNFGVFIAKTMPWLELFAGLFLVLGLWLKETMAIVILLFLTFLFVVGQALVRKLPIDECGCFGELLVLPPEAVFAMDTVLLICSILLIKYHKKALRFSLDSLLNK